VALFAEIQGEMFPETSFISDKMRALTNKFKQQFTMHRYIVSAYKALQDVIKCTQRLRNAKPAAVWH
jgi:hypothetical protein